MEVVEKELFDLATSVWADRATTSESKDFLDKPRVERICFEKDWNRIYTKSVRACVCSPLLRSNDFVFLPGHPLWTAEPELAGV